MQAVNVALYGSNGHQVDHLLATHPQARLVAVAGFERDLHEGCEAPQADSLDDLLADDSVDLVSLCSPRRRDQAADAIRCLEAGKHVYAEKPAAMTEADLDAVVAAAARTGQRFHEMAGSAFEQPYLTLREQVLGGAVGTVVQVFAQKSYPYHERRPQDEDVDGGLTLQVGVHALRFVCHVTGLRGRRVAAVETQVGNPSEGDLRMAVSMMLELEGGAIASVVCNYLNSNDFGSWGNEHVRIWGTAGFVESVDAGQRTRLCLTNEDHGPLDVGEAGHDYLQMVLDEILGTAPMPLSLEEELHPLRLAIRARESARG